MKRVLLSSVVVFCMLLAPLAHAATILDPWAPDVPGETAEKNLYTIYNTLFGTAVASSQNIPGLVAEPLDFMWIPSDPVTIYARGGYAGWSQELGYSTDGGDFTSIASGLNQGDTWQFSPLFVNLGANFSWVEKATPDGEPTKTFYSNSNWNPITTQDHFAAFFIPAGDPRLSYYNANSGAGNPLDTTLPAYFMAFDDFGSSPDFDYNDLFFVAQNVTPVPVPGAVWLLGAGLVGLVGLRRRFVQ